jgi:hypothetical protein
MAANLLVAVFLLNFFMAKFNFSWTESLQISVVHCQQCEAQVL